MDLSIVIEYLESCFEDFQDYLIENDIEASEAEVIIAELEAKI